MKKERKKLNMPNGVKKYNNKKEKTQEERIQEIEKEIEEEFEEDYDDLLEDDNEKETTIENFRLHKSLVIAETEKAVLIKIGKGAFWLNKNFIIPSKYSNYNQIGIVHEFKYILEINETKKEIQGSKLIKVINEYKDRRKTK